MGQRVWARPAMRAAATSLLVAASLAVSARSSAVASSGPPARALAAVPGTGAARPRILMGPGQVPALQAKLAREPERTVFVTDHDRAAAWRTETLGDDSIATQRDLTRAAEILAFEYALDRTVVGGAIVPFATAADRQSTGDFVRRVLLQVYPRSRLAVPAPLGGFDRDINTSEEITNAATAYDTLVGAGYALSSADHHEIVRRLASVTDELWRNYVDPATAHGAANTAQNNHRTKSGAAMAVAAVALGGDVSPTEARNWFDTGTDDVDDVLRSILVTGDGAYGEGPFYYQYTLQNLVPYLALWERFLGAGSWTTRSGLVIPSLAHTPQFARAQQWTIDLTLPDGTLAPVDDSNVGRSSYFGALPSFLPTSSAAYWRWANEPSAYDTDGNIDLGPWSIAAYDDTITPAPPTWAPTQFYDEGGDAILRSSWSSDATEALVLGEHDTASSFGQDRTGAARYPESHEHADPGAFQLYAYGQQLALDPGYLSFTDHGLVDQPEDHNIVLVGGKGPSDYLVASLDWAKDPQGRPPAEGQSSIGQTLDSAATDAATVATNYRGASITRRFLFGDDRYLVVADHVGAPKGTPLGWVLHGNGGGTSGGTFARTAAGGRWTIGGARLDSAIATGNGAPATTTRTAVNERPGGVQATHTALVATTAADAGWTTALQLLYPTASGATAPTVSRSTGEGVPTLSLVDRPGDRRLAVSETPGATSTGPGAPQGARIVDRHLDGSLRLAWQDGTTTLSVDGHDLVRSATPGSLGLHLGDGATAGTADVVAQTASPTVSVGDVGFTPRTADGACGVRVVDGRTVLRLNRERRVTLRAAGGNTTPGADAGPDRQVAVGSTVTLDGSASCDADGDPLTARWELVSAPRGSSWSLSGTRTMHPRLRADATGPYRIRLVVTDSHGARSREQEVTIVAGPRCRDGVDNDLDGLIDTDDPDCDAGTPTTSPATVPPVPPASVPPAIGPAPIPGQARYTG